MLTTEFLWSLGWRCDWRMAKSRCACMSWLWFNSNSNSKNKEGEVLSLVSGGGGGGGVQSIVLINCFALSGLRRPGRLRLQYSLGGTSSPQLGSSERQLSSLVHGHNADLHASTGGSKKLFFGFSQLFLTLQNRKQWSLLRAMINIADDPSWPPTGTAECAKLKKKAAFSIDGWKPWSMVWFDAVLWRGPNFDRGRRGCFAILRRTAIQHVQDLPCPFPFAVFSRHMSKSKTLFG